MANFDNLEALIDEKIVPDNHAQLITGRKLNDTLHEMVDEIDEKKQDTIDENHKIPYSNVSGTPTIPSALSQLNEDTTHRVVTDAEKTTWNGKQDAISDLATIRSGAEAGATALQSVPSTYRTAQAQDLIDQTLTGMIGEKYTKPQTGIPATDLASGVQTTLGEVTELSAKVDELESDVEAGVTAAAASAASASTSATNASNSASAAAASLASIDEKIDDLTTEGQQAAAIAQLQTDVEGLELEINGEVTPDKLGYQTNYYLSAGKIVSGLGTRRAVGVNFIPVNVDKIYTKTKSSGDASNPYKMMCAFYTDSNEESYISESSTAYSDNATIQVPNGAKYFRIAFIKGDGSSGNTLPSSVNDVVDYIRFDSIQGDLANIKSDITRLDNNKASNESVEALQSNIEDIIGKIGGKIDVNNIGYATNQYLSAGVLTIGLGTRRAAASHFIKLPKGMQVNFQTKSSGDISNPYKMMCAFYTDSNEESYISESSTDYAESGVIPYVEGATYFRVGFIKGDGTSGKTLPTSINDVVDSIVLAEPSIKEYNIKAVSRIREKLEPCIENGEYGLLVAYTPKVIYNDNGTFVDVESGLTAICACIYHYYSYTLRVTPLREIYIVTESNLLYGQPLRFDYDPALGDFSEDGWVFTPNADGNYTILEQVYAKMDALVLKYPKIFTKYDPMANAAYTDDSGIEVQTLDSVRAAMNNAGFSDYPIYAKGISTEGTYTIGEYTVTLEKTPAYKTFVYKLHNPSLDRTMMLQKKNLYIQCACQGNEFTTGIAAYSFIKRLLETTSNSNAFKILERFDIYVVPNLNGYSTYHKKYVNALGVNVNRNYPTPFWEYVTDETKGLAACDQFEAALAVSLIDFVQPVIAVDVHNLDTNPAIGVGRSTNYNAFTALMDAKANIFSTLMNELPQYFGTKMDVPELECDYSDNASAAAQSYFFYKGIYASALCEVINRINFMPDENGECVAITRDDTLYNADVINVCELLLRNIVFKLCELWLK